MPRWEPDAADRLERAALELFAERGFEHTTVPEIAQRAGMTTRSFFRHFPDKREVLFHGDQALPERIALLMASAPTSLSVMEMLIWGVESSFRNAGETQRAAFRARRAIIATDAGLQERELRKVTQISDAITEALTAAGLDPLRATIAGKLSVTISSTAFARWLDGPEDLTMVDHVRQVSASLTDLVGDRSAWPELVGPGGGD
jgi:AcrR family transcriptional regulator